MSSNPKVLIMDDEALVRELVSAILEGTYEVVTTVNGVEAVGAFQAAIDSEQPFDLVILDLVIPGGMGGVEVMKKLWAINPEVKVIVSSGYSNEPVMANFKDYGFKGIVPKPYRVNELIAVMKQVLLA